VENFASSNAGITIHCL